MSRLSSDAPTRVAAAGTGRTWPLVLALLALAVSQPLTTLHFASDGLHLSNAFGSMRLARPTDHPHRGSVEPIDGHSHSGAPDRDFRQVCVLLGAASPRLADLALVWPARLGSPDVTAVKDVRADAYSRLAHPPRAPPRLI